MKLKLKLTKAKKSLAFPVIKQSYSGKLVLFTKPCTGTCIYDSDPKASELGVRRTNWFSAKDKTRWKTFNGSLQVMA